MNPVVLYIERLVLHGLPAAQAEQVRGAAAAALTRLLGDTPLPQAHGAGPLRVDVTVPAGARPEAVGEAIARSLHASLTGAGEGGRR